MALQGLDLAACTQSDEGPIKSVCHEGTFAKLDQDAPKCCSIIFSHASVMLILGFLMHACVSVQIMSLGTTLNFQFYLDASDAGNGSREATETTGLQVINLQHVDHYHESVHDILHQLVKRFSVPEKLRWDATCNLTAPAYCGMLATRALSLEIALGASFHRLETYPEGVIFGPQVSTSHSHRCGQQLQLAGGPQAPGAAAAAVLVHPVPVQP